MDDQRREGAISKAMFPLLSDIFSIQSHDLNDYREAVERVVNSSEVNALLLDMLKKAITSAKNESRTFNSINVPIVLWQDEYKLVMFTPSESGPTLGASKVNESLIANASSDRILGFIGHGNETIKEYVFETDNLDAFVPGVEMALTRAIDVKGGEVHYLAGGNRVYEFNASHNILSALSVHPPVPTYQLSWLFDRHTLRALRCASASTLATRLQYVIKLFLQYPSEENTQAIAKLARESEFHFVRWDAIKALLQLDFNQGYDLLESASNSEHPHLMNAAQKTLQNMAAKGFGRAS